MIRIALIGYGNRGERTLERYADIPQELAQIVAVADLNAKPHVTHSGPLAWKEVCAMPDINLVVICTDWASHTRIACEAMRQGKHVCVEVPAATSIEECQELIRVSKETNRECFMVENCCYDLFHLCSLSIVRQGLLGDVTHMEGAYIHELGEGNDPTKPWMLHSINEHQGNPYPTHAIGPMLQILAATSGGKDTLQQLVSMSHNNGNDTLIRTRQGRTLLVQLDFRTPRPYSRNQAICGTEGFLQKYPLPTLQVKGMTSALTGDAAIEEARRLAGNDPIIALWEEGQRKGVANPMNYAMDMHMLTSLTTTGHMPQDATMAALCSVIAPLTEQSVVNGFCSVEIPQF